MPSKTVRCFETLKISDDRQRKANWIQSISYSNIVGIWTYYNGFSKESCIFIIILSLLYKVIQILIKNYVEIYKMMYFEKASIDQSDYIYVIFDNEEGKDIIKLEKYKSENIIKYWFKHEHVKYVLDESSNTFYMADYFIDKKFKNFREYNPLTKNQIKENYEFYGKNIIEMNAPPILSVFLSRIITPSSIFNFFFIILCVAEGYRMSIILSVFVTIIDITAATINEYLYNKSFKSYETKPVQIEVYRGNKWEKILTTELVPGDVICLERKMIGLTIPADILVLKNSCLVDESILTGESIPQIKESIINIKINDTLNYDIHGKNHIVYSGTTLLSLTCSEQDNFNKKFQKPHLAIVLRTGFYTCKGDLFRSLLYQIHNENLNDFETYVYIFMLFLFGLTVAFYTWYKRAIIQNTNDQFLLAIHCIKLIVNAIPIDLSTKLLLFLQAMNRKLRTINIFTMRVDKITHGGKLELCFFDKTGTITEDNIILKGVGGLNSTDIVDFKNLSIENVISLVGCTSLYVYQKKIIGDPIDSALIDKFKCILYEDGNSIKCNYPHSLSIKFLNKFQFESSLRRMSCVVVVNHSIFDRGYEYFGVVKGAPESLKCMFIDKPINYDELNDNYSSQGYRVIAFGYKKITDKISTIKREDVESDLIFGGFLLSRSKLKSDAIKTIDSLHQIGLSTIMISGDNPYTACFVSMEIGMTQFALLILYNENNQLLWKESKHKKVYLFDHPINDLTTKYRFCITGETFKILQQDNHKVTFQQLMPFVTVYARVDPAQKELIIKLYKEKGYCVMMCGDGANDIGALKVADIGIALLNVENIKQNKDETCENVVLKNRINKSQKLEIKAENIVENDNTQPGDASIAAPFTFKGHELYRCVEFIKYCMCALSYFQHIVITSTVYCFTYVYMQSTHYSEGLIFSDKQQSFYGIFSLVLYYSTYHVRPSDEIPDRRPIKSLFHPYIILSILSQSIIHTYTIYYISKYLGLEIPMTDPLRNTPENALFRAGTYNTVLYYYEFFIMLAISLVNYNGSPFSTSITKNKLFITSIISLYGLLFGMLLGLFPSILIYLELVSLPKNLLINVIKVIISNMLSVIFMEKMLFLIFVKTKKDRS